MTSDLYWIVVGESLKRRGQANSHFRAKPELLNLGCIWNLLLCLKPFQILYCLGKRMQIILNIGKHIAFRAR
jgi:hypothetical protein